MMRLVHRLQLGLGTWLSLLSLVASVPLLLFTTTVLFKQLSEHEQEARASQARRAEAAAEAVGQELRGVLYTLHAMAQSDSVLRGDLAQLQVFAGRVVASDERIKSISLSDTSGHQLFTTLEPSDAQLPEAALAMLQRQYIVNGLPHVSPLMVGDQGNNNMVVVMLPTTVGSLGRLALRASVKLEALSTVLTAQPWNSDWTAAILDQNMVILARNRDAERFVGKRAHPSITEGTRLGQRQFDAITKEGARVAANVAAIPGTGWVVAVGRPLQALVSQARASMAMVLGVGALCALLSAGASQYLARAISRQFRAVAMAQAAGVNATGSSSGIREVSELAQALRHSKSLATQATDALDDARHDALTGLPGRALFMERAQRLADEAAAQNRGMALLFIDLDGFKEVNDRLGHEAGDGVLKAVAQVLRHCVRAEDTIGRLGGDEFVVCVRAPGLHVHEMAAGAAQRIIEGVSALGPGIGCSIGTAFARGSRELHQLLDQADHAMFIAKRGGKNRVAIADA
jgi:diguanylate cyclase (GGDEF)-like protein